MLRLTDEPHQFTAPSHWLEVATPTGIRALVTSRHYSDPLDPSSKLEFNLAAHIGDDEHVVVRNRSLLARLIGEHPIQWLDQVHGTECLEILNLLREPPSADAACTLRRNLALAVMTADCVPILLWDQQGQEIAACHAGWQGLINGVIASTVNTMHTEASHLAAWVGPCISGPRYEVGADVWQHFTAPEYADCLAVHETPGKKFLDIGGVAYTQLANVGVKQCQQAQVCTYDSDHFYSHRAYQQGLGVSGRFASLIWMT